MIIKKEKLQAYLDERNLTRAEFAKRLGVEVSEVDKMLSGEPVGYDTARKFIYYLKANSAQHYVDWDTLGVKNPLTEEDNENDDYKEVA